MKPTKIIGLLLIIGGLTLGYSGINKVNNNSASIGILDINIDLSNKSGKQEGYMYMGLAVILFAGGVYTLNKK